MRHIQIDEDMSLEDLALSELGFSKRLKKKIMRYAPHRASPILRAAKKKRHRHASASMPTSYGPEPSYDAGTSYEPEEAQQEERVPEVVPTYTDKSRPRVEEKVYPEAPSYESEAAHSSEPEAAPSSEPEAAPSSEPEVDAQSSQVTVQDEEEAKKHQSPSLPLPSVSPRALQDKPQEGAQPPVEEKPKALPPEVKSPGEKSKTWITVALVGTGLVALGLVVYFLFVKKSSNGK